MCIIKKYFKYTTKPTRSIKIEKINIEKTGFSDKTFEDIKGIPPHIKENISQIYDFQKMTEVQYQVLKRLPIKFDLLLKGPTGSGKTISYLIPMIDTILREFTSGDLEKGKLVGGLILAPTRELASQIALTTKNLVKSSQLKVLYFIGGTSKGRDLKAITTQRVDIIIATPGRIVDLIYESPLFVQQLSELKVVNPYI